MLQGLMGVPIFDGFNWHHNSVLWIENGKVSSIEPVDTRPATQLEGGFLCPGLVDLQVNGGAGVLFNSKPEPASIERICAAHNRLGTTSVMPTLITDDPKVLDAALKAAQEAINCPSNIGLHLEGPHLALSRKGTHEGRYIRQMERSDMVKLLEAARTLPRLKITVAPEAVSPEDVAELSQAGVYVSLGHSDANYETAMAYGAAGASIVTHLFNAMSQFGSRSPGLVGAALNNGHLSAGLIADGYHVNPAAIEVAMRGKKGPGRLFLVSDAMSTVGSDIRSFVLNGRTITRQDGRLTLDDGTLAGADICLLDGVRFMVQKAGTPLETALQMGSRFPAETIGATEVGHLKAGAKADILHLDDALSLDKVWLGGKPVRKP